MTGACFYASYLQQQAQRAGHHLPLQHRPLQRRRQDRIRAAAPLGQHSAAQVVQGLQGMSGQPASSGVWQTGGLRSYAQITVCRSVHNQSA